MLISKKIVNERLNHIMKHYFFTRLQQVWKDLKVHKALWELWELWENRATRERLGQQGPRVRQDLRDLQQLNLQRMQPPLVLQDRQVNQCRCN